MTATPRGRWTIYRTRSILLLWSVLLLGSLAAPSAAETPDHPNLARGVSHNQKLDSDAWSKINLFNGNLHLDLPLGGRYPLDSLFGYQLALSYNSNVWDLHESGEGWLAEPVASSNAGLGFDLSLGRLLAPEAAGNPTDHWVYVAPDGASRLFFSNIHWDTPDPADPNDDVQYTRDGSYLRLQLLADGSRTVERPDATRYRFEEAAGEWRLVEMRGPGSTVAATIAYAPDGSWTLNDGHGRSHTVHLMADPAAPGRKLVASVDLAAFGATRAVYSFDYTLDTVPRPCTDPRSGTVSVSLLSSVLDPAGRSLSFAHVPASGGCESAGRLAQVELVTGGSLRFGYGSYELGLSSCAGPATPYLDSATGVVTKEAVLPNGTVESAWSYSQHLVMTEPSGPEGPGPCDRIAKWTEILTPRGDRERHYFSIAVTPGVNGGPADYGLPYTRYFSDSTGTRFLSTEILDCDSAGTGCAVLRSSFLAIDQDESCSSLSPSCWATQRRLASRRTVFHDDPVAGSGERFADTRFSGFDGLGNFRVTTLSGNFGSGDWLEKVQWFNPDSGGYPGGSSEGGPGFTFPGAAEPWSLSEYSLERISDDQGSSIVSHFCHDAYGRVTRARKLAGSSPGPADVVRSWSWSEGSPVIEELHGGAFDPLAAGNDLCALDLGAAEYQTRRTYRYGVLASEELLDGSGTVIALKTLDRDIDRDTGAVAASRSIEGIETAYLYDSLGRSTWEMPESGHGAWTERVYRPPTGGSGWSSGERTTTYRRVNGSGAVLTKRQDWLDHFGGAAGHQTELPGLVKSLVREERDLLGALERSSAPHQPGDPVVWTEVVEADPFGRPRIIRPPSGAAHDRTITYYGERAKVEAHPVGFYYSTGLGECYEDQVLVTEERDRQGRVWKTVREQAQPAPATTVTTEMTFDALGRELSRQTTSTAAGSATSVSRTATSSIDGRAFLLHRTVTNSDPADHYEQRLSDYDSAGLHHRESRIDPTQPLGGPEIRLSYDAARRLVLIADAADPNRLWKEFEYGTGNQLTDLRQGKLVRALRHNYHGFSDITVEERYEYAGLGGGISAKETEVRSPIPSSTFVPRTYRQEVEYGDLGQVSTLRYPTCIDCAAGEPVLDRQVDYSFEQGRLIGAAETVDGSARSWLTSVAYGGAGQPVALHHGNGVVESFVRDPASDGRPLSVNLDPSGSSCAPYCQGVDLGPFVYDGGGGVCGIGSESKISAQVVPKPVNPWAEACDRTVVIDPFSKPTGEISDPDCRPSNPESTTYFDAFDRLVGLEDLSARKLVEVAGSGQVSLSDPDNWTRRWTLYGIDGRPLRTVVDSYAGDWRQTDDRVWGAGELIGSQVLRQEQLANSPIIRHHHSHAIQTTDPQGLLRSSTDLP